MSVPFESEIVHNWISTSIESSAEESCDVPRVEVHERRTVDRSRVLKVAYSYQIEDIVDEERNVGNDVQDSHDDDGEGDSPTSLSRLFWQLSQSML